MCIDIVEIWFDIAIGQISSIFNRVTYLPHDSGGVLSFHVFIMPLPFSMGCGVRHIVLLLSVHTKNGFRSVIF